jgi:hypothetical protein
LRSKWAAGRRSEPDWRMEGAYLNRYVTDEQRSRRPIFIATLWAGADWLFFRVARSTRMAKIGRFHRQPGSDRALKNSQLTSGKILRTSGTGLGLPGRLEDQICDRIGMRNQGKVTRLHLDRLRAHAFCHEPFEIRINGPVVDGYGIPARL